MVRPARQRNPRGQGGLLRDEILSAAIHVIDQAQNEVEVSLRSIARAAGISTMSVYSHFADRDAVLAAVAELSWQQVCQDIVEQAHAGETPRSRLLLGCRAYVAFAQRFPLRYSLMTQVDEAPPAARQALAVMTRGLLAIGDTEATGSADGVSDKTAAALSVALHGVAMLHRTDTPHLWLHDFSTCDIIGSLVDAAVLQIEHAGSARAAAKRSGGAARARAT
ncbi:TetR/AcrR family transcriptional regulator [Mycobacterium shigaense]|uniref:Putative transcriptional regulator, TetR family protein n=1 Tax=Mycobacterium shigaense TaxID=722731 RepID=A0A1Z4EJS8_9MYCO|nr:TetR/AcrR family transcriptional regulator [Mycobacterium shigaense]MEA1123195.1 TetR/AcrR family transcriptional regulator [Mycobacterium shigaense]PRI15529.1 TetR family transcriptional regulator [Mycobacterium shigaense]BAX93192.1 putative transcriptional regulator, TetR family protein [Mycobacterium shigaense]